MSVNNIAEFEKEFISSYEYWDQIDTWTIRLYNGILNKDIDCFKKNDKIDMIIDFENCIIEFTDNKGKQVSKKWKPVLLE